MSNSTHKGPAGTSPVGPHSYAPNGVLCKACGLPEEDRVHVPAPPDPPVVVGEVSVSWTEGGDLPKALISQRFQDVINVNLERGYELVDWKLSTVVQEFTPKFGDPLVRITETIVAVFRKISVVEVGVEPFSTISLPAPPLDPF